MLTNIIASTVGPKMTIIWSRVPPLTSTVRISAKSRLGIEEGVALACEDFSRFFFFLRYRWYCLLEEGVLLQTPTAMGHPSWPLVSFLSMCVSFVSFVFLYGTEGRTASHYDTKA